MDGGIPVFGTGTKNQTAHPRRGTRPGTAAAGFSLLEVLIALVVLSIGLLGVAAMSIESFRNGQDALLRTRAVNLAADIADTIRTNRPALTADANAFVVAVGGTGVDNQCRDTVDADGTVTAAAGACTPADMAAHAVFEWKQALADPRQGLPAGDGAIARDGLLPVRYTISVLWTERGVARRYDMRTQLMAPGAP